MEYKTFRSSGLDDLDKVACSMIKWKPGIRVFALKGKMGAGKTTLIKSLCACLGVEDVVNSPTFALVNEYSTADDSSVFHFDFYRIEKTEEVFDIGYEEYFYSGDYCFIEWPELVTGLLPGEYILVDIIVNEDDTRVFNCSVITAEKQE